MRLRGVDAADMPCGMRTPGPSSTPLRARSARRRRLGVALLLPLAAAALGLAPVLPARAQSPLIQGWLAQNTLCKGGLSDDPKTQKACKLRDQLNERLKRRGCQYQQDGDWWKCPR